MNAVKVVSVNSDSLTFDNGVVLSSDHQQDCCEHHYLSFDNLTISNFEGLEFDLTNEDFFERIEDFGIALKPKNGHPVRVPGYGSNNGYYSSQLDLVLKDGKNTIKKFDISECQVISD